MALGDNWGEAANVMLRAAMPSTDAQAQLTQQGALQRTQLAQQGALAQMEMQLKARQYQQMQALEAQKMAMMQQQAIQERRDKAVKDIYSANTPDGMRLALEMNRPYLTQQEYSIGVGAHKQFGLDWANKNMSDLKGGLLEKGLDIRSTQPGQTVDVPADVFQGAGPQPMNGPLELNALPKTLPGMVAEPGWTPLTVGNQTIYAQPKAQRNYGIENGYLLDKSTGEVHPLPPSLGNDNTPHSVNFGNDITIVTKSGQVHTIPYNSKPHITHDMYGNPVRITTDANGQSYMTPIGQAPQTNNDPLGLR